jgi:hypothetical protein
MEEATVNATSYRYDMISERDICRSGRTQWARDSTKGERNRVERGGATSSGIPSVRSGCPLQEVFELVDTHPEPTRPA